MDALIYFVVWAVIIFFMMRVCCGAHILGHGRHERSEDPPGARDGRAARRWVPRERDVDPVCGETVRTEAAKPSVHDGTVYYFCSRECREAFEAAPHLHVGPEAETNAKELEGSHV